MLRPVHSAKDWLELAKLAVANEHVRVIAVGEKVDAVIGPLVNKARARARVPRRR